MIPNRPNSTNARTKRNSVEAKNNNEVTIFFVDTPNNVAEEKKWHKQGGGILHVVAPTKNKRKGKKVVNFSSI